MRFLSALVCLFACLPGSARGGSLTVSAAVSMKDALAEVALAYGKQSGAEVKLNFGSSGQIMTQIARGAPVDVFVSAGDEQMDQLEREKLIDPRSRVAVAGNRLVLVVPGDFGGAPISFEALAEKRFKRISIGHPDTVPAGKYAMQVLEKLGLSDIVRPRLVYGANVRQVLSYVERGEVEAGIVYRTDPRAAKNAHVIATADASWHEPIRYPAAVVSASKHREAAEQFVKYLCGDEAQQILTRHGFTSPSPSTQSAR
jgi:molybdate transport system substrate-binding protein